MDFGLSALAQILKPFIVAGGVKVGLVVLGLLICTALGLKLLTIIQASVAAFLQAQKEKDAAFTRLSENHMAHLQSALEKFTDSYEKNVKAMAECSQTLQQIRDKQDDGFKQSADEHKQMLRDIWGAR